MSLSKRFKPLDEATAGAIDDLWMHPYGTYVPDPRKEMGLGTVDYYQQVVGLPGGEGFSTEGDDPLERLRAERDAWGVPNGQDPDSPRYDPDPKMDYDLKREIEPGGEAPTAAQQAKNNDHVEKLRGMMKNIKGNIW